MKHISTVALFAFLSLAASASPANAADASDDEPTATSGAIIDRYLRATQANSGLAEAMEVDIDASVPKLNEHGRLRALRKISEVGKITYRVLGFQGDNTVKSQIIARYLQAEQQGQDDSRLKLNPANYRFKLKDRRSTPNGTSAYVFQVTPRKKRIGLFKGELWIDAESYLPVIEKGRLVKNPSMFFRKVDFERDFDIRNGSAVPAHMSSTIDTRLVGKVNLRVAYSSPAGMETSVPASF